MDRGGILEVLAPPPDIEELQKLVPELRLGHSLQQGDFHHLDVLGHTFAVLEEIEAELAVGRLGARIAEGRVGALRLAGLLHDIAKPVTRAEIEGRLAFVAHDSLGAQMAFVVSRRLELAPSVVDMAVTLTALHLKLGFMHKEFSDYPPRRLARAVGLFGEELAVLSWADRLGARGERLRPEQVERHRDLCVEFLEVSREGGSYPEPDYEGIGERFGLSAAGAGYAAGRARLMTSRGMEEEAALELATRLVRAQESA